MSISRLSPDVFLIFYSVYILTLNTGHCQFTGRRFGVSRTRFRQQIPWTYRPSQQWGGRSQFSSSRYNNRAPISNYRGDLNTPSRFRNTQYDRGRETYSQVPNNEQNRGMANRNYRPSGYINRDTRLYDRTRYSTFSNRGGRVYDQSPNVVQVNTQNERFRYSTRGSVDTIRNYAGSTERFSPYSRELTLNGMSSSRDRTMPLYQGHSSNYVPTYNSPLRRFSPEQTYQTSSGNQLSGRSGLSRRYQSPTNDFSNYSPTSTNYENVNPYQLRTPRVATRPRLRAERNEVFQYRTSVMRAPQSDLSGSRNHVDRQSFSGYPVQSLSLPFEPLSLRYQGFRDSKRAGQQEITSDRTTNVNGRNTERNQDSGTLQTVIPLARSSVMEVMDRATNFNIGSTNGVVNTGTHQPVVDSVRGQMLPDRTTNFVHRNTGGNARIFQPDIPVQGRLMSGRTTSVADRNRAMIGNTRTLVPGMQSGQINDGTTSFNERHTGQTRYHRSNQPGTIFQRRLGQTRVSANDARFRNLQQSGDRRSFRQNNPYTNRNVPGGSLHKIFGISRAGLEGALHHDQSVQGTNTYPVSNNVPVVESNQRPKQLTDVQNFVLDRNTNTDDQIENRANLIADITKDMDIADRLNLLRNRQISNKKQINILTLRPVSNDNINGRRIIILTRRPSNNVAQSTNQVISRTTVSEEDNSIDDIEDDFAGGPASTDDKSSTQSRSRIRDSRRNFIESDEENEDD